MHFARATKDLPERLASLSTAQWGAEGLNIISWLVFQNVKGGCVFCKHCLKAA